MFDMVIGVFWVGGMVFGILLIKKMFGYYGELMGYFFGNFVYVFWFDVYFLFGLIVIVLFVFFVWYWCFFVFCVDFEYV